MKTPGLSDETPTFDSVGILRQRLQAAVKKNPNYSLRAFAKKLGLSPAGLSLILARKKRLSLARAHAIAEHLDLDPKEKERFLLVIQYETAKSAGAKSVAYEKLKKIARADSPIFSLSLEQFRMVSEWYGLAILEMISTFAGGWKPAAIAEYLDIPKLDAEVMLDRLLRLELIERTAAGGHRRVADRMLVVSGTPSEAIRNYYRGVLAKADDSVETQSPTEKVIGTEVFAFDPDQLDEVRRRTDAYLDSLLELAKTGKRRTELYQVMTDFFRLNPKKTSRPKKGTTK